MRRNLATLIARFPGLYRQDIFEDRRKELGWGVLETARRANVNRETVRKILAGKASGKTAYPVSEALGLDWAMVHDLELKKSEFHLAVRNGGSER